MWAKNHALPFGFGLEWGLEFWTSTKIFCLCYDGCYVYLGTACQPWDISGLPVITKNVDPRVELRHVEPYTKQSYLRLICRMVCPVNRLPPLSWQVNTLACKLSLLSQPTHLLMYMTPIHPKWIDLGITNSLNLMGVIEGWNVSSVIACPTISRSHNLIAVWPAIRQHSILLEIISQNQSSIYWWLSLLL